MYIQDGVKYHANGKESEIIRSRNLQKNQMEFTPKQELQKQKELYFGRQKNFEKRKNSHI